MNIVSSKHRKFNQLNPKDPLSEDQKAIAKKYDRSQKLPLKQLKDKKLKTELSRNFQHAKESAIDAARTELLLTNEPGFIETEGMEKSFLISQDQLKKELPKQSANKILNLDLPEYGPFVTNHTRDGRFMVLGGERGQIAMMDRISSKLQCELFVNENIRDVQFLHNHTMFAVAQKKYCYIYDKAGVELHVLRKHIDVNCLDFLPFHFLLVSVGGAGYLKYQDVATGDLICEHRTKLGPCFAMQQNPTNAVMHLGHLNGNVTLWTPNVTQPVAKVHVGAGAVQALSVTHDGKHMVTGHIDGCVRIWDLRTYKKMHTYRLPGRITSVDVSQRGLLSTTYGTHCKIFSAPISTHTAQPYMYHSTRGSPIRKAKFIPYDDVLSLGHDKGVSNIVVPGAGEPNFDSFVASPFETTKQMKEREVQSLLEKLQPNMISLNDMFGTVRKYKATGGYDTVDKKNKKLVEKQKRQTERAALADDDTFADVGQESDDDNDDDDNDKDENGVTSKRRKRKRGGRNEGREHAVASTKGGDAKREKRRNANDEFKKRIQKEKQQEEKQLLQSKEPNPVLDRFKKKKR